jgi:hypothetical protein
MADLDSFTSRVTSGIGASGAVEAINQLMKSADNHGDGKRTSHLVKAGVGAAVAIGAYELLKRGK